MENLESCLYLQNKDSKFLTSQENRLTRAYQKDLTYKIDKKTFLKRFRSSSKERTSFSFSASADLKKPAKTLKSLKNWKLKNPKVKNKEVLA